MFKNRNMLGLDRVQPHAATCVVTKSWHVPVRVQCHYRVQDSSAVQGCRLGLEGIMCVRSRNSLTCPISVCNTVHAGDTRLRPRRLHQVGRKVLQRMQQRQPGKPGGPPQLSRRQHGAQQLQRRAARCAIVSYLAPALGCGR